jgi:hypothetical protein
MRTMIFVVAGLAIGTLGGTAFGGLKEKAVLVAQLEAEKAAEAAAHLAEEDSGAEAGSGAESHGTEGEEAPAGSTDSFSAHGEEPPTENASDPTHDVTPETPDAPGAEAETQVTEEALGIPASNPNQETEAAPPPVDPDQGPPSQGAAADTTPGAASGTLRLSKIFGAMKAPDAAKVLQNLDDEEVSAILFHLSDRKAAEILGNFVPERAATLSRAVLTSRGGEES